MTPVRRSLGPDDVVAESATIPADIAHLRLDQVVAALFGTYPTRGSARKACDRSEIAVDGVVSEPSRLVQPGQLVQRLATEHVGATATRLHISLEVVFEDDHLAVILKPSGMPTSGAWARAVDKFLPQNLVRSTLPGALARPHPVHRLDAPTSGLLLVAKTRAAQAALGQAFEQHQVHKRYRALVIGELAGEGVVDLPVEGREARSRWRAVRTDPALRTGTVTTVELVPETGRTHQLRRHLASLGHPILGDEAYGVKGRTLRGKGLFLFADRLAFAHPTTGEALVFELPEPAKFASFRDREARRFVRWHQKAQPDPG